MNPQISISFLFILTFSTNIVHPQLASFFLNVANTATETIKSVVNQYQSPTLSAINSLSGGSVSQFFSGNSENRYSGFLRQSGNIFTNPSSANINSEPPAFQNGFQSSHQQSQVQQSQQRYYPTTRRTFPPTSSFESQDFLDIVCGVPEYKSLPGVSLIQGGSPAARGQFPWLVAYFHKSRYSNSFICGGSLISKKIVVTAAHCIQDKQQSERKLASDSTFYIGKHNLDSSHENNYQLSVASELHTHPEWNPFERRYLGDIAVVILQNAIVFNKFVKPICIWKATQSSEDIFEREGYIAGWGKTEFDAVSTSEPLYVKLPAVSGLKCAYSHEILGQITSEKTFCVGIRGSNKSTCRGDSGGAFVMTNHGKSYLRGIVSCGLIDQTTHLCDTRNYFVFTDASKYTDWISYFVSNHG